MNLTNQHRAILITLLISGTVILSVFNLRLKKHHKLVSESYYKIEPEENEDDLKPIETLNKTPPSKSETNNAFNETQKTNRFAQAYKSIAPPKDYIPKTSLTSNSIYTSKNTEQPAEISKLNAKELSKYNTVNNLLKKQYSDGNNSNSSISFSLTNRTKTHIPIPVYLCEANGKIVINITVNAKGNVINTSINTTSTSTNACLIEHALEYAKNSQFSQSPSKKTQIGTITFNFIGK